MARFLPLIALLVCLIALVTPAVGSPVTGFTKDVLRAPTDIARDDPVPPLGAGDEELISGGMKLGAAKKLVDGFVDRCEKTYTRHYDTPPGFVDWLAEHPQIRTAFWLALVPGRDRIPEAMKVLDGLRIKTPERVEKFPHLAIAFAVVWDSPAVLNSARQHGIWGFVGDQLPTLPTLEANWEYFSNPAHQRWFTYPLNKLAWPMLVYIVNLDISDEERAWAIAKFKGAGNSIKSLYETVPYDFGKLESNSPGSNNWALGRKKYTIMNLLKYGGVCGDRAFVATRVAKLLGVPAMKCTGLGKGGGAAHAWYGAMNFRGGRARLEFEGRYQVYTYYTGDLIDLQTSSPIMDRELQLMLAGAAFKNFEKYIFANTLTRIAARLFTEKPALSLKLVKSAIGLNQFCAPAWPLLMEHAKAGNMDIEEAEVCYDKMFNKELMKFPDVTIGALDTFINAIDKKYDVGRERVFRQCASLYAKARRPDLKLTLALKYGIRLAKDGEDLRAVNVMVKTVKECPGEGLSIMPLIREIDHLYHKLDMLAQAYKEYEKIHRALAGTVAEPQFITGYIIPLLGDLDREDEIPFWRAKLPEWAK